MKGGWEVLLGVTFVKVLPYLTISAYIFSYFFQTRHLSLQGSLRWASILNHLMRYCNGIITIDSPFKRMKDISEISSLIRLNFQLYLR